MSWVSYLFLTIEALLKLVGLYNQFMDWSDKRRQAEIEEKEQRRDEAIDKAKEAKTPEEAWDAQEGIVSNEP